MNDLNDMDLAMFEERNLAEDTRGADEIAKSINRIKAEVQEAVLDGWIRIGRELHAAKSKVPYGEWGSWLKTHVNFSERAAQDVMRIAEEYGRSASDAMRSLSKTQAIALLGLSDEQREEFVATHDMDGITTDQLKAQVKELKERAKGDQQTIAQLMAERDALREESAFAPNEPDDSRVAELEEKLRAAEERAAEAEAKAAETEKSVEYRLELNANATKEAIKAKEDVAKARQEKAQLETQLQAYKQRAEIAEKQKERTEEQLLEERAKGPRVEYQTPPEVEQELARLRADAGRSEGVQRVRMLVEQLGNVCQQLRAQIGMVMASDPETGEKLRAAAVQVLTKQGMEMGA